MCRRIRTIFQWTYATISYGDQQPVDHTNKLINNNIEIGKRRTELLASETDGLQLRIERFTKSHNIYIYI